MLRKLGEPKANAHGANPELMERLRCLALQRNFSREYRGVLKIESITLCERRSAAKSHSRLPGYRERVYSRLAAYTGSSILAACTGCLHWLLTLAAHTGRLHLELHWLLTLAFTAYSDVHTQPTRTATHTPHGCWWNSPGIRLRKCPRVHTVLHSKMFAQR